MTDRSSMRGAAVWAFLATAGTRLVTLVSLAVLARLLAPREFGLLAFALVYITYAETVGDLGTAAALIYWKERREDAAQVTFAINAVMGVIWFAVTLLLAPAIAAFFRNPEAAGIVRLIAVGFLIKFLGNTHDALAQKDLRFRARAVPEVGLAVVKAGVSIALAAVGMGAWSLVWGHLAGLTAWTLGAWWIVPWRPRTGFPRDLVAPMLRYGRGIVGVNVLAAVVHHADLAVIGRMLGPVALGLYQVAWKIPEATITVIIWVVAKVLFPAFSRIHDAGELRSVYLRALTWVSLVTVPIAATLAVLAEPLVRVFFGPKWAGAAPLLQLLAIQAGLRALGTHAGDVLKATGRTGLLVSYSAARAVVLVPALIVAAGFGVRAVAGTLVAVTAVTVTINIAIVMRILRFGVPDVLRALRTSLAAGAALVAAGILLQRLTSSFAPGAALAMTVVVAASCYAMTLFVLDRPLLFEAVRSVTGVGRTP